MKRVKGMIQYKMKSFHPDVKEEDLDKIFTYEDTYTIDPDRFFNEDHMINHISSDLIRVASGGYDSQNIYDIEFTMEGV